MKTLPVFALAAALLAACSSRPVEEIQAEEATVFRTQADEAAKASDFVLAIDLYTESLKLNSTAAETWFRRGNAYVKRPMDTDLPNSRREWIRQAERDYSAALRLNPALTPAYFNRAMVYMKTRRF